MTWMTPPYRYRVNFGQGQVHYAGSKRDCLRFIGALEHASGAFVELQDPDTGDWFRDQHQPCSHSWTNGRPT